MKAGTQANAERNVERKKKMQNDERAYAHCEGAHGYTGRRDRLVYSLAVVQAQQPTVCS